MRYRSFIVGATLLLSGSAWSAECPEGSSGYSGNPLSNSYQCFKIVGERKYSDGSVDFEVKTWSKTNNQWSKNFRLISKGRLNNAIGDSTIRREEPVTQKEAPVPMQVMK